MKPTESPRGNCQSLTIPSDYDGLPLSALLLRPEGTPRGLVAVSHGMAEHKERYLPFLQYLTGQGYACLIHDHRGHGGSVRAAGDLGYFYTADPAAIVEDLHTVIVRLQAEYPGCPVALFSHSMGTLVARNYCKRYDATLAKLVLCGPPTDNPLAGAAIGLARVCGALCGDRHRSPLIDALAFGAADRKFGAKHAWLCSDPASVARYEQDPLCGFLFTANGYLNLFRLQRDAFRTAGWQVRNPDLPILLIAGADDPIIQTPAKFEALAGFLHRVGYRHIDKKLYPGLRHELLLETRRESVFADVAAFLAE